MIQCVKKTSYDTTTQILTLDYITDTVIDNITLAATPYVSPDVNNVVYVEEETGKIHINQVTENGKCDILFKCHDIVLCLFNVIKLCYMF